MFGPRQDIHEFIFGGNHRQDILSNNLPEIWGNALDNDEDGYEYDSDYEDEELYN